MNRILVGLGLFLLGMGLPLPTDAEVCRHHRLQLGQGAVEFLETPLPDYDYAATKWYDVIETRQGDLYFDERTVVKLEGTDSILFQAGVMEVTVGTGAYEGATSVLVLSQKWPKRLDLLGLTPLPALAADRRHLGLQGETFQPQQALEEGTKSRAATAWERQPLALEITLPELVTCQRFVIGSPSPARRPRVGLHRELPTSWSSDLRPVELARKEHQDGSYVSALSVRSPGAAGPRLATAFRSLPEETEIRYYSLSLPERVYEPLGRDLVLVSREGVGPGELFWSPLVSGDNIVLESREPNLEPTHDVRFSLGKVAHNLVDPIDMRSLEAMEDSGRCNQDVACKERWAGHRLVCWLASDQGNLQRESEERWRPAAGASETRRAFRSRPVARSS